MSTQKKKKEKLARMRRISFPSDEQMLPWLPLLLEAHAIVDRGVAGAVASEKAKGRRLACQKGCSHCCSLKDIPVYPLELMGLSWYAAEKIIGSYREMLIGQLSSHKRSQPCPFLLSGACMIHPIRPMACRQFNVFQTPCEEGEDPYYARPGDLLKPVNKHVDQAFLVMLPFHGVEKASDRIKAVESGVMHRLVKNLPACNWKILAERMKMRDGRSSSIS